LEIRDIDAVRISLASPEQIREWSYGEVTKPETINYRRLRPEKDGLFCEAIFGPTKDWQCYCGKYKKIRYRGIVCEKCGVEVTHSRVRRERMGHIELAAPIAHIWYTRRSPSYLGLILNISQRNLDRVLYFAQYIITEIDEDARQKALHHLDEELTRERERLDQIVEEQVQTLEAELAGELQELREQHERLIQEFEERLTTLTNEVMSQATVVQQQLDQYKDQPAPVDLVFALADAAIVPQGELVTRDAYTYLNQVVQDKLSEVETTLQNEKAAALAPIEAKQDHLQQVISDKREELQQGTAGQFEQAERRIDEQREELRGLRVRQLINESRHRELEEKWPRVFRAGMGAQAIYDIVKSIDLEGLALRLRHEIRLSKSKQRRKKAAKRLRVVEALRQSNNRPEWMILTVLPVIPPDLRPMVQLDGGRFATSDLNDLYRRVVNRNNRLKHLIKLQAPEVIVRNEMRMLQEAVDSLIDNSRRGKAISLRGSRQLKSLSDMLKGKQGRFRRNLLGKRVDYSGRSVIVVGPELKLHQCGLPKRMALELFRPFVMQKLVEYNHAINIKGAKRLIEREAPEVWEVLEELIRSRPVLLNRAPTLHRLGIQAFEPVLVEGNAIQIHPLVCAAFNADFDGDQMAVHVPLSDAAVAEARELMLSNRNLLLPANGEPIVGPTKDMVLGCYYLTMEESGAQGEGKTFADYDEVSLAYSLGKIDLHAKIKFYARPGPRRRVRAIDTTVGRVLFNEVLPAELRFYNEVLDKGRLKALVGRAYQELGATQTAELVDKIKDIGFKYATRSGITVAIEDLTMPEDKPVILDRVSNEVAEVERQYRRGLITENEQYVKTVELWTDATEQITRALSRDLDHTGSIGIMADSGATKGGLQPIRQLAGMRGLMADPSGRIIALPIRSNFREGLNALEYFISTHGARKGLADTALRTADAGYLTRRLVDVSQDCIINEEDCGTKAGIWIDRERSEIIDDPFAERILGRVAAGRVVSPKTGDTLVEVGEMLDEEKVRAIEEHEVERVHVRSPLTCALRHGICAACYGRDLAKRERVHVGEAVGIIAAQSIGEPGTQLTLRTFHTGGVAGTEDITQGLPRVQELFESRNPKGQAVVADISGVVHVKQEGGVRRVQVVSSEMERTPYTVPRNYKMLAVDGAEVEVGDVLAKRGDKQIVAETDGHVAIEGRDVIICRENREEREYEIPATARLRVDEGQTVVAGDRITEGALNPHEILDILGMEAVHQYLLEEIQLVYRTQGVTIHDKHIEVIVKQMLRRVRVTSSGDTHLLPGDLVDRLDFQYINNEVLAEGGEPATAQPVLLGITKAALNTESFLSAASFQHTISVLSNAAIEGKRDDLHGLKESVIIGKLIPAGTGFRRRQEKRRALLDAASLAMSMRSPLEALEAAPAVEEMEMAEATPPSDAPAADSPEVTAEVSPQVAAEVSPEDTSDLSPEAASSPESA
jgi:DNA-directed RNA polymerase subunit beta'